MDSQMMGNVMMIALSGMGVTIDKIDDQFDKCTFWVSVPETSDHVDAHGNEMAGAMLTKRIKTTMTEMTGGTKPIVVRSKSVPATTGRMRRKMLLKSPLKERFITAGLSKRVTYVHIL